MDSRLSLYPYVQAVQALRDCPSFPQIPQGQVTSRNTALHIQQISSATTSDIDRRWSKKFMPREFS